MRAAAWRMRSKRQRFGRAPGAPLWLVCALFVGLSLGCSAPAGRSATPAQAVVTQPATAAPASPAPPTLVITLTATQFRLASPTPQPSPTPPPRPPTSTPVCQDGLRFLADITIPDGTIVAPGETLDKQWQVENSGSCNWNERYRLRRISGPALGAPDEQPLYPARSGTQAIIRILLVAPSEPGTYRSAWQAYNPQGEPFGDPIFVEILVSSSRP